MGSVFAWLDNDDAQQRKMAVLKELSKDESTVDELGTGTIRDTIANALFPGTSVVQTRVRYLLFTAWLVRDMAGTQYPGDQGLSTLRSKEAKLIDALLASGETDGVIGRQARGRLKSMPSRAYWASLGRFGIRTWDVSIANHLRARQHIDVPVHPEPTTCRAAVARAPGWSAARAASVAAASSGGSSSPNFSCLTASVLTDGSTPAKSSPKR